MTQQPWPTLAKTKPFFFDQRHCWKHINHTSRRPRWTQLGPAGLTHTKPGVWPSAPWALASSNIELATARAAVHDRSDPPTRSPSLLSPSTHQWNLATGLRCGELGQERLGRGGQPATHLHTKHHRTSDCSSIRMKSVHYGGGVNCQLDTPEHRQPVDRDFELPSAASGNLKSRSRTKTFVVTHPPALLHFFAATLAEILTENIWLISYVDYCE